MAKKEKPEFYVMRQGYALYGEMKMDRDRILAFPQGERIRVDLRTGRVPARLQAYWAFLHKVVEATGCAPDAEALHETIKLLTGYTTPVQIKGMTVMIPRSIAFNRMTEDEFAIFFDGAVRWIAETYGIAKEEIDG